MAIIESPNASPEPTTPKTHRMSTVEYAQDPEAAHRTMRAGYDVLIENEQGGVVQVLCGRTVAEILAEEEPSAQGRDDLRSRTADA